MNDKINSNGAAITLLTVLVIVQFVVLLGVIVYLFLESVR